MRAAVSVNRGRRKRMCVGIAALMDELSTEETTALGLLAAACWIGVPAGNLPPFQGRSYVKLARILMSRWPSLMKQVAFYELLGRSVPPELMPCFNHGFHPGDSEVVGIESLQYSLYSLALAGVELDGATILELGCGRGFGTGFLCRTEPLTQITGIDPVVGNIELATRRAADHDMVKFHHGFADDDWTTWCKPQIVVSIESAHSFGSNEDWLAQNVRRLNPGTIICLTDVVQQKELPSMRARRQRILREQKFEEITPGVIASLELMVSALDTVAVPVVRALLVRRLEIRLEQYRQGTLKYFTSRYLRDGSVGERVTCSLDRPAAS